MLHAISRNEGFNTLIEIEPFYNQPVKKNKKHIKTYQDVKKWWLYNRKFIISFVS